MRYIGSKSYLLRTATAYKTDFVPIAYTLSTRPSYQGLRFLREPTREGHAVKSTTEDKKSKNSGGGTAVVDARDVELHKTGFFVLVFG